MFSHQYVHPRVKDEREWKSYVLGYTVKYIKRCFRSRFIIQKVKQINKRTGANKLEFDYRTDLKKKLKHESFDFFNSITENNEKKYPHWHLRFDRHAILLQCNLYCMCHDNNVSKFVKENSHVNLIFLNYKCRLYCEVNFNEHIGCSVAKSLCPCLKIPRTQQC